MKNFKAGTLKQQLEYKSFIPSPINRGFDWDDKKMDILYGETMRLLGELNAYASLIPDVDFFILMSVVREAAKSNMIEGTQTGIDEVVLPKEEIEPERRDDWSEVQNYIRAMNFAIEKLAKLPVSIRLLKDSHKLLLSGVRGKHKMPGQLRKSQNWIGGSSLANAFFIPPSHDQVVALLSDLEKFWHNNHINVPSLIKIAIIHYQFETIHPFLDGNGRIGRLLITLQLIDAKILTKPTLYLSAFFEKHRTAYYDALTMVRKDNRLEQWVTFFLRGVAETAQDAIDTFKAIIVLRQEYDQKIMTLGLLRVKNAQKLLLFLFSRPIVNVKNTATALNMSFNSANRLLNALVKLEVLKETTGFSRNRYFVLEKYLNLFKK